MKSSSFIFILFIIENFITNSKCNSDKCEGRWQIIDKLNIKITLDWQILPKTNKFVSEFRTNRVAKGFWYGFSFSSSLDEPTSGLVYALRLRENDTQIFWDIYNVTESNVIILKQNNSSLIKFQRLTSSGLLTVQPIFNLTSFIFEKQCLYFVYMRGRFKDNQPLVPDEINFNRSLCLICQQIDLTSMSTDPPTQETTTTHLTSEVDSTVQSSYGLKLLNENTQTSTGFEYLPFNSRREYKFFWFGRIVNRSWLNDYYNLSSLSSQNLRLDLQNLFLFLINHNSSFSFICNQFELYSLQSGSILFASNITLTSNLSEDQTINTIEELIRPVNHSKDYNLYFDLTAHHIKRTNEISDIDILFTNLSRTVDDNYPKQAEIDSALRLLISCIIGVGCFMILIITILCLYGYYKCRRRQFRLYTERQTFKFKHDINSYRWLGQQPSISSSSPYLIQSTSI